MDCMFALATGSSAATRAAVASEHAPLDEITKAIRSTIATVESNKAIVDSQTNTAASPD